MSQEQTYTVFVADRLLCSGPLTHILLKTKAHIDAQMRDAANSRLLIFQDENGRQIDFDFHGTAEEVVARVAPPPRVGPGRPRLGVVAREISLLPRHWEWLEQQPNGASASLRRLVDEARKREPAEHRARQSMDATYRLMTALCGDRSGYEEAIRALYAGERARFMGLIESWPDDIISYLERLTQDAFATSGTKPTGCTED